MVSGRDSIWDSMGYEWFVSLRYLRAKRKQTFISVISFISIAGVTLGVAALILVLAVMTRITSYNVCYTKLLRIPPSLTRHKTNPIKNSKL